MKRLISILILSVLVSFAFSLDISHIEPPNWWTDMQHDTLKLLVYGDDFRHWDAKISSKAVKLIQTIKYEDKHYMGLLLKVKRAGKFDIIFKEKNCDLQLSFPYEIKKRDHYLTQKIDARDVIYLLMPDRFSDGDKNNNSVKAHSDPIRRNHKWGRKGGDIQGVIKHMDYLQELGISALWMTPLYENNYINCYHGYTPTNLYSIDPFMGSLEDYHDLVKASHERGIKIIQDHIVNHISPSHPLAVNPPNKNWINGTIENHEGCNYRIDHITDYYGPEKQRLFPTEGWFAGYLADMNMANPDVVDYYIYHAIWWIETMKLDGIREDTYAYSDLQGLSRWAKELKREYPDLFIVGEIMDFDRTRLAYYFNHGLDNYLSSVADFGFSSEIYQLIVENKSIDTFYKEMANDFIYRDPNMMMTFMDNHDMGRFYSSVNGDVQKYLNAFTFIFSMRGIPQLYYGNEIGLAGGHDPENRREFPGGFDYSEHNAFSETHRNEEENLIFNQIKQFTQLRKDYPGIFLSKMKHDLKDDVYLLSRQDNDNYLLMAYNAGAKSQEADYSGLISEDLNKIEWIKLPLKGKAKLDIKDKTFILPPRETILIILKK